MGKNGKLGKDYGKVVGKDTKGRPGWRGPGFVKKANPTPKKAKEEKTTDGAVVPLELQQPLLNIFRNSFSGILASETLTPTLQKIKTALYERDFTKAFGKEEYLEAYSVRWSPSRALCYQTVLVHLQRHLGELSPFFRETHQRVNPHAGASSSSSASLIPTLRVVSFGGGAAEVVAFGGLLRHCHDTSLNRNTKTEDHTASEALTKLSLSNESSATHPEGQNLSLQAIAPSSELSNTRSSINEAHVQETSENSQTTSEGPKLPADMVLEEDPLIDLHLLDTASWGSVSQRLHHHLRTPPPLSKYASVSAKDANFPLIQDQELKTTFSQEDVLDLSLQQLEKIISKKPTLITLLFTLNELYTTSISKTTAFLLKVTTVVTQGSLLLVVDSPGSYSETIVGNGEEPKKYPMHWLMDHFLLGSSQVRGEEEDLKWEKVVEEDSKWFRMPESLRYPIPLESMRYQVHLYRRL